MRVLIVDDHPMICQGLVSAIGAEWPDAETASAGNAEGALAAYSRGEWSVCVLDVNLGESSMSGLAVLPKLKEMQPHVPVLVFSMYSEEQMGIRALHAGADGYVNKEAPHTVLIQALQRLMRGGQYVSSALARRLEEAPDVRLRRHDALSAREHEVLRLLAGGRTTTDIAVTLELSAKTISTYRTRVLKKLDLDTTADLIRYAIEHRLVGN